jgi:predicted nucleic acid-binding protein
MINTPGIKVIIDSDALIAILNENDLLSRQAGEIVKYLAKENAQIIYPITTITESVTTLIRKFKKPTLAVKIIDQIKGSELYIQAADDKLLTEALSIFNPTASKKCTIFDAIVAATAKKLNTPYIFSFDKWYTQLGFTLVSKVAP